MPNSAFNRVVWSLCHSGGKISRFFHMLASFGVTPLHRANFVGPPTAAIISETVLSVRIVAL